MLVCTVPERLEGHGGQVDEVEGGQGGQQLVERVAQILPVIKRLNAKLKNLLKLKRETAKTVLCFRCQTTKAFNGPPKFRVTITLLKLLLSGHLKEVLILFCI